jgi:hypothetical protein
MKTYGQYFIERMIARLLEKEMRAIERREIENRGDEDQSSPRNKNQDHKTFRGG